MPYNRDTFALQYSLVDDFVRHLFLHRRLKVVLRETPLQLAFWGLTADAHLVQAAIYWCMVFGSSGMNKTHWKHLEHDEKERIESMFRDGLVAELGITFEEWQCYWTDMLYFRNNYSAHRAGVYDRPVPSFDNALSAAYYYDTWAREIIKPDVIAEPRLRDVAEDFANKMTPMLSHIVRCGAEYEKDA